jgi:hypothetical protein
MLVSGLRVASACLFYALLMVLNFAGGQSESFLAVRRRERQRVDHGVGGGANLIDRDLWIFPP